MTHAEFRRQFPAPVTLSEVTCDGQPILENIVDATLDRREVVLERFRCPTCGHWITLDRIGGQILDDCDPALIPG